MLICLFSLGTHPLYCDTPGNNTSKTSAAAKSTAQVGVASYYGEKYDGKRTASGELFDMNEMTAAHPTLPFGTRVRVTHLGNKRSVVVRINDRGPFVKGRIIDLSRAAAEKLDMIETGLAEVRLEILK